MCHRRGAGGNRDLPAHSPSPGIPFLTGNPLGPRELILHPSCFPPRAQQEEGLCEARGTTAEGEEAKRRRRRKKKASCLDLLPNFQSFGPEGHSNESCPRCDWRQCRAALPAASPRTGHGQCWLGFLPPPPHGESARHVALCVFVCDLILFPPLPADCLCSFQLHFPWFL